MGTQGNPSRSLPITRVNGRWSKTCQFYFSCLRNEKKINGGAKADLEAVESMTRLSERRPVSWACATPKKLVTELAVNPFNSGHLHSRSTLDPELDAPDCRL
jgi:hypothetical protein